MRNVKHFYKAKAFTLLELMLCFAILALFSSALVWNGLSMIQQGRFNRSAQALTYELLELRALSMSHQCDISIIFSEKKGGYFYKVESDEPFSTRKTGIEKKLNAVKSLCWNGKRYKKFKIKIAGDLVAKGGILAIEGPDEQKFWIDLRKQRQIHLTKKEPEPLLKKEEFKPWIKAVHAVTAKKHLSQLSL